MNPPQTAELTPAPAHGTSLVDRVNVAIHLRRYMKIVARRWLILFTCTCLGLAHSLYKVFKIPDLYQASSELEVTRKVQVSAPGGAVVLDPMDSFYPDQQRIMGSASLRVRVLANIRNSKNPRVEPPNTQYIATRGQGASFQLTVISPEAEYAKLYASNWAQAFLQYKKEQLQQLLETKKFSFLQDIYRQEKNLEKAREASDKFRREHKIGSASDTYKATQQELDQRKVELARVQTQLRLLEETPAKDIAGGALADKSGDGPRLTPPTPAGAGDGSDPLSKFTEDGVYVQLLSQL